MLYSIELPIQSELTSKPWLEAVDGKVAAALCMGSPTKYVYREGSGLTDAFLYDEVCPHIHVKFGGRVTVVLGKSLLWACKEPVMIPQVPACLRQRVMQAYEGVMQLEEDINPIQKRRLVVYNVGGQLRIDKEGNPVHVGEGQHEANMNDMLEECKLLRLSLRLFVKKTLT